MAQKKPAGKTDKTKLPPKAKKPKPTTTFYQFKITLLESKPPIWRRIHVNDCTLDKLHEHIQTAMGWTNSHLHHFKVGEQLYGDPMLMEENMEDMDYKDSTRTKLSAILPSTGKRFSFQYEYDFGDSWDHEVLFEGVVPPDPKVKYPRCLEGATACPPEDCGGVWGYSDFLEAIRNKDHEEHERTLRWAGGWFRANSSKSTYLTVPVTRCIGQQGVFQGIRTRSKVKPGKTDKRGTQKRVASISVSKRAALYASRKPRKSRRRKITPIQLARRG